MFGELIPTWAAMMALIAAPIVVAILGLYRSE